jgi:hypothetical protein
MIEHTQGRFVVGIDNGLDGGVVVLDRSTREVRNFFATKTVGRRKEAHGMIDFMGVCNWLIPYRDCPVFLEEPLVHAASSQAMRSMSISYGLFYGALTAAGMDVHAVQVKDWQDWVLGKKRPGGQTKQLAAKAARRLWPDQDWIATKRSRTPHDGLIDAALIAFFAIDAKKC